MLRYTTLTDDEKMALRLKPMSQEEEEALRKLDEEDSWLLDLNLMAVEQESPTN